MNAEIRELSTEDLDTVSGGGPRAFEIKDFSFGVENPTTIGSATGGRVDHSEFKIVKLLDAATPK
jgi:hypothetical protein